MRTKAIILEEGSATELEEAFVNFCNFDKTKTINEHLNQAVSEYLLRNKVEILDVAPHANDIKW